MSFHSSIEVPQSVDAPRKTKRTRVLMTASLLTPDGTQKVTLRDISRTGAQLVTAAAMPTDCDVIFKRGPLFAAARVAWSSKGEVGLKFYRELSSEEIEGCLPTTLLRGAR